MNAKRGWGFCLKLVPLVSSLNRKPRLEDVLSWTSDSLPMLLLLITYICYLQLKLSTGAAGLVAQSLSCKTLPTELGRLRFCRKWSLEHALPVSPWSCKSSKRGFSQQVRAIPGE